MQISEISGDAYGYVVNVKTPRRQTSLSDNMKAIEYWAEQRRVVIREFIIDDEKRSKLPVLTERVKSGDMVITY
jgi:hypothetical protein